MAKNNLPLAEWLLSHGASANAEPPSHPSLPKRTLHEEALRNGFPEMAELLVRFGATPNVAAPEEGGVFVAACLRLDREAARTLLDPHPEYLLNPRPMHLAAERDRTDFAEFLLDLGVSPDVEEECGSRSGSF